MTESTQSFDWGAAAPEAAGWPHPLQIALNLVLHAGLPMCLTWGEDFVEIHNEAFRPLLGSGGEVQGRPLSEAWREAWPRVEPALARALAGEATTIEDLPLRLERRGYPEHTWWKISCSPAPDYAGRIRGVLCIGHETTAEVQARASLPVDRERLARLFDQAPAFITYLSGPNHVFELDNQPLGQAIAPGRGLLGKTVREAFPDLAGQEVYERLDEVYRSGERHVETARKMVFTDAEGQHEHYINQVYQPVLAEDGSVIGIFVIGQEVTELVRAAEALHEREERLRLAVDAGRMAVWDVDVLTGTVAGSAELNRMLGLEPDAEPTLAEVHAQYFPGELDRLATLMRDAQRRGERFFEAEYRHVRADTGEVRWFLIRAMTDFSDAGRTRRSFGVLMDVTERKEAEDRLKLLALEVDHRANNLLASVQSVVTLTRAETIPRFRESVMGRISALANAHRLLAESRWTGARLARIVLEEVQPFVADARVRIEGPDASLAPAVAQGLAVALHELVTNAVKHGALSREDGQITLAWSAPDDERIVQMTWSERGGPPVSPPDRAGFGLKLLRRALAGPIGGSVALEWRDEGLCCTLRIPV
jgi:PAS domain S-box-containing protein